MRPQSGLRLALSAALIDGGGTSRELASRVGADTTAVMLALHDMVRAGDARKARLVRVPGVKRPVPWYERAESAHAGPATHEPITSLISMWVGSTARASASEAAM